LIKCLEMTDTNKRKKKTDGKKGKRRKKSIPPNWDKERKTASQIAIKLQNEFLVAGKKKK